MSVNIVERLRLNEDDWLFGQTARDARREIITLREQVERLKECLSHYAVYQTAYGTKNAAAKLLEELK